MKTLVEKKSSGAYVACRSYFKDRELSEAPRTAAKQSGTLSAHTHTAIKDYP